MPNAGRHVTVDDRKNIPPLSSADKTREKKNMQHVLRAGKRTRNARENKELIPGSGNVN